jgi:hypothetical protein
MDSKPLQWAMHQGQYYIVTAASPTHLLIRHHGYHGGEFTNIALNGQPITVPALKWAERADVLMIRDSTPALPPAPTDSDRLEIGTRCTWGTSLGLWAITAINGELATIHHCSGWAMATPFTAPLSELTNIKS